MTAIFLHVPKSAGSTLHTVLERMYPSDAVYDIPGPMSARETTFSQLSPEEHARIRLVKGHILFGIHRCTPNPFTYITVLRHPVERVISHYYFVKRRPHHRLHDTIASSNMSLEEYVLGGTALELDNGQVRAIYGSDHLKVGYGDCTDHMLESALDNLESYFSVVGIAERFDETLLLMARRLNWNRRPLYVRRNVTKNRPALEAVSPRVLREIEAANALDLALYERSVQRFDEASKRHDVPSDLDRFRQWNELYGRCAAPISALQFRLLNIKHRRRVPTHV
ncbi:MAG: sulfotransferase family 2 domain-containing protein [Rhodothermales bacterium]